MKGNTRFLTILAALVVSLMAGPRAGAQTSPYLAGVTPSADELAVNETLSYTISITNVLLSPFAVFVTNVFPSTVEILSVSNNYFGGVATNDATRAIFIIPNLGSAPPAQLTISVRPTVAGLLTNQITIVVPQFADTNSADIVTSVTNLLVDLAVTLSGPPLGALLNDLMPYLVTVRNLGGGAVTNAMLTNTFPAGVEIVSPNTNQVLALGRLAGGAATNVQFTLRPTTAGVLTFSAAIGAGEFPDSNLTNNTASTNITVQDLVTGELIATNLTAMTFNPQHSLMEQTIRLVNVSTSSVASARVIIRGLTTNWLYNAVGTNSPATGQRDPFVVHGAPLTPGASVDLLLEYVVTNRLPVHIDNSNYVAVAMPAVSLLAPTNFTFSITNIVDLQSGGVLVEFPSIQGRSYTILYNSDAAFVTNTRAAQPPLTAQADRVQWIDDGPPKTISHPTNAASRFYRALLNP